jgi:hypothetical protein
MASISPVCKKFKHFILSLKSPTYRDFMIKKSLKSKISKSHTWAPLTSPGTLEKNGASNCVEVGRRTEDHGLKSAG